MMKGLIILIVLVVFFVAGCATIPPSDSAQPAQIHKPVISLFSKPTTPINITPYSYKGDFKYTGFVYFYGNIDKDRIMDIIYSINSTYFEGVNDLSFVYSNKGDLRSAGTYKEDGFYTPNKIEIYIYNETDSNIKYLILHELKHHLCFKQDNYITVDAMNHRGCFLNTPIDKEYGFIR